MTDECKQDTPNWNTHVNISLQINTFYKFESLNTFILPMYMFKILSEVYILYLPSEI